jgi:hypothetical protein
MASENGAENESVMAAKEKASISGSHGISVAWRQSIGISVMATSRKAAMAANQRNGGNGSINSVMAALASAHENINSEKLAAAAKRKAAWVAWRRNISI